MLHQQWKRAAVVGFAGGCTLEGIAQAGGIWKGVEKRRAAGEEEGDESDDGDEAGAAPGPAEGAAAAQQAQEQQQ